MYCVCIVTALPACLVGRVCMQYLADSEPLTLAELALALAAFVYLAPPVFGLFR